MTQRVVGSPGRGSAVPRGDDVGEDAVTLSAAGAVYDFAPAAETVLRPLVDGRTVDLAALADAAGLVLEDVVVPPARGSTPPAGADYYVRAGQAACAYSWKRPPSRLRRRMSRWSSRSGSVIGSRSGRRGAALCRVR